MSKQVFGKFWQNCRIIGSFNRGIFLRSNSESTWSVSLRFGQWECSNESLVFPRKFSTFWFFVETLIKFIFRRKSFVFHRNFFGFRRNFFWPKVSGCRETWLMSWVIYCKWLQQLNGKWWIQNWVNGKVWRSDSASLLFLSSLPLSRFVYFFLDAAV